MPISSVNRIKTIGVSLSSDSNAMAVIYENTGIIVGREFLSDYKIVSFNTFIKNLKVFASINSLDNAILPDFKIEDSDTDRLHKVLDIEWKSPRKQIDLFIQSNNKDWLPIGSTSLLNPAGYPFRIYNLMDLFTDNLALELGDNSRIGIKVKDVGYGLLASTDLVTIHGSYVEEIYLVSKEPPINITVTGTSGGSVTPVIDNSFNNTSLVDNTFLVGN